MINEKGSLEEVSVLKLLLGLYNREVTGILYLKKEGVVKVLYFKKGRLIWAISNSESDRLENMLIANDLVSKDILEKLEISSKDAADSIGKNLVEKGIITLEQLIEYTKVQLEKIIFSVLRYSSGEYQFEKEDPPRRLLSLDIDITGFIRNFILDEVDTASIWKTLGSLQTVFAKNPDINVEKYDFSEKQLELLDAFSSPRALETVMSMFDSSQEDSLLKMIFFLHLAQLIRPAEETLSSPVVPSPAEMENEEEIESIVDASFQSPRPPEEEKASVSEEYHFDPEDEESPQEEAPPLDEVRGVNIDLTALDEDETMETSAEKPLLETSPGEAPGAEDLLAEEREAGEKKKRKWVMVASLLFFMIVAVGGVLYFQGFFDGVSPRPKPHPLEQRKETEAIPSVKSQTEQARTPEKIMEEKPAREESAIRNGGDDKPGEPTDNLSAAGGEIKSGKSPVTDDAVDEGKPREKPSGESGGKSGESFKESFKRALSFFQKGDFIVAADIWKDGIQKSGASFAILLELDCLKESVRKAYGKLQNADDFFILLRRRDNRVCFLVCLGPFPTREEAQARLRRIPDYFFLQQSPPVVTALDRYLE